MLHVILGIQTPPPSDRRMAVVTCRTRTSTYSRRLLTSHTRVAQARCSRAHCVPLSHVDSLATEEIAVDSRLVSAITSHRPPAHADADAPGVPMMFIGRLGYQQCAHCDVPGGYFTTEDQGCAGLEMRRSAFGLMTWQAKLRRFV